MYNSTEMVNASKVKLEDNNPSIDQSTQSPSNYVQDEEKKSAKDKLFDKLNDGVRAVLESEKFKDYLKTSSRLFYNGYSMRNTLLIHMQKPDASYVNGYEAWKEYGRAVKLGAKGISIIMPVYASEKVKGGLYGQIKAGLKAELDKNPSAPYVSYRLGQSSYEFTQNRSNNLIGLRKDGKDKGFFNSDMELRKFIDTAILGKVPVYFNVGHVFDVKDVTVPEHLWVKRGFTKNEVVTDESGNPIKNNKGQTKIINTPERQARFVETIGNELAAQDSKKMTRLLEALMGVCSKRGIAFEIRNPGNDKNLQDGAEGYFTSHENYNSDLPGELKESLKNEYPNGVIVVNGEMDVTRQCSVLVHELAHGDLHSRANIEKLASEMDIEKSEITRRLKETQAQAVAYGVGSMFGIEDTRFSFEYMASYAGGVELQELNMSLNVIHKEIQALIKDIHIELDNAGYTHELEEKANAILESDYIAKMTENNLNYVLEQEKVCQVMLKEIYVLYDNINARQVENANSKDFDGLRDILESAKKNVDIRLESIEIIKNGLRELENLNTREAQENCIDRIECAASNLHRTSNAFDGLSASFQNEHEKIKAGEKSGIDRDSTVSLSIDGFSKALSLYKETLEKANATHPNRSSNSERPEQ